MSWNIWVPSTNSWACKQGWPDREGAVSFLPTVRRQFRHVNAFLIKKGEAPLDATLEVRPMIELEVVKG